MSTRLIFLISVSSLLRQQGGPVIHPSFLLKLYIYGYLNRVQSSRRLERETLRNVEVMWLLGRLSPDHHLIIAHDVIQSGSDRASLAPMANKAKDALGVDELDGVADRGYFSSEQILECSQANVTATLPKPMTTGMQAKGQFGKPDFRYVSRAADDTTSAIPAVAASALFPVQLPASSGQLLAEAGHIGVGQVGARETIILMKRPRRKIVGIEENMRQNRIFQDERWGGDFVQVP